MGVDKIHHIKATALAMKGAKQRSQTILIVADRSNLKTRYLLVWLFFYFFCLQLNFLVYFKRRVNTLKNSSSNDSSENLATDFLEKCTN